jgi:hypothetical protein
LLYALALSGFKQVCDQVIVLDQSFFGRRMSGRKLHQSHAKVMNVTDGIIFEL